MKIKVEMKTNEKNNLEEEDAKEIKYCIDEI
jgi:hypothetical protein